MTLPPLPKHLHWNELVKAEGASYTEAQMREYATAAVLAERAACAAMCDEHSNSLVTADDCAAAIRARSDE